MKTFPSQTQVKRAIVEVQFIPSKMSVISIFMKPKVIASIKLWLIYAPVIYLHSWHCAPGVHIMQLPFMQNMNISD